MRAEQTEGVYPINIDNPDKLRPELLEGPRVFNQGVAGPHNIQPLALSIRDRDGVFIGGLLGLFYWNMLLSAGTSGGFSRTPTFSRQ